MFTSVRTRLHKSTALALTAVMLGSCAVNPVTGQRELGPQNPKTPKKSNIKSNNLNLTCMEKFIVFTPMDEVISTVIGFIGWVSIRITL